MSGRNQFIVYVLAWSLGLYFVWWAYVSLTGGEWLLAAAGFSVAAVAVLLASQLSRREKLGYTAALLLLAALGEIVAELAGIVTVAGQDGGPQLAGAAYHTFRIGLPITILLIATKGDRASLWQSPILSAATAGKCPICGAQRVGMEAHVKDAHGEKELARVRARGLI